MPQSQVAVRPQMHWQAVPDNRGGSRLQAAWSVDTVTADRDSHAA